jgi:Ferritin-like
LPNSAKSAVPILDDAEARSDLGPVHDYRRPDMSYRDHLVMMLTSGAEVEHALMVQYLYAAYSINGDQKSKKHRAMVEGWRASILSVAREEMGHLLTVQNALVLLGAPLNLGREMMPWDHQFYPFPFSLEPLSEESLQCFIYAEMPRLESIGNIAPGKKREKSVASMSMDEQKKIIREITGKLARRFPKKKVKENMHRVGELYDEIIARQFGRVGKKPTRKRPRCTSTSSPSTSRYQADAIWRPITATCISRPAPNPATPGIPQNISWSGNANVAPGRCFTIAGTETRRRNEANDRRN